MVDTIKFSQMTDGGDIDNNKKVPGLKAGGNVLFNNPWTFLPPGTTAERPTPSAEVNYRLRFNTEEQLYEYYDAVLMVWTQLQESAFTQGPFVIYKADASIPDGQNLGALADGILKQTITLGVATLDIAVNGTDYFGPGVIVPPNWGGTGIDNGLLTINLASGALGYVLTSDSSGNATWEPVSTSGSITTIDGDSGSITPTAGVVTINGGLTGLTTTGAGSTMSLGGLLNSTFGGLGISDPTAHGVLIGEGASPANSVVLGAGQVLIGTTASDPVAATITSGTNILVDSVSGGITIGITGIIDIVNGGTGVSSVTTSPTPTAWAGWDANSNLSAHNFISGFSTTVTAAGTTTLTVASNAIQEFTGTTTQTVVMPVVSTLVAGQQYTIINNSSANVTVNSSGGNAIQVMAPQTTLYLTCVLNTGTTAASWNGAYVFENGAGVLTIAGTANQINASSSTGNITLSLSSTINAPGTFTIQSTSAMDKILDEDNMVSNSATALATQQSIKAYVDAVPGKLLGIQVITSSSTVTSNASANKWLFIMKGAGGGGAGGTGTPVPGQGGSEGGIIVGYATVAPSTGYTYTQGAGGTGGSATNNGNTGGNSTLVISPTTYTADGGGGGGANGYGSTGGFGSGFLYGIAGVPAATVTSTGSSGGGAGGGAGAAAGGVGVGASSGGNSGAGGAGGYGANAGGTGGSGYLIVYEYS